jgi:hypothetical protein
MSGRRLAATFGWIASAFALALPLFGTPARDEASRSRSPRPIRLVANEVIERAFPNRLDAPSNTARRISVKGGLVGLGSYNPRGGADFGMYAPPRHLFPGAGVGSSLNVDPNTGRSYFTNLP